MHSLRKLSTRYVSVTMHISYIAGHERPKRHKAAVKYMDSASDFEVEQLLNNDANGSHLLLLYI